MDFAHRCLVLYFEVIKEDLVGRYLKALVNNPVCIGIDIGEYLLVTKWKAAHKNYSITRVRDNKTISKLE